MNRIDELKAQGLEKIPFQYFVEMYSGDARFERLEDNHYRIVSFNPESLRTLPVERALSDG
ncbi:MAG TPA: hypothetical protein VEI81_03110 [Methanoregula sp.]|nr:hypothetical protein [Methanoregula sp.]